MIYYPTLQLVGYGVVGKHIAEEFKNFNLIIKDFDLIIKDNEIRKQPSGIEDMGGVPDFTFICVPTPINSRGDDCDISEVINVLQENESKIYIIKSTMTPNSTKRLQKLFPQKRIVFSPETYGNTQHCEHSPNFLILGGDKKDTAEVANLYSKVKDGSFKIYFTDSTTAELYKYMLNCFLALKVTFCNEFADIADKLGVSYPELRELFIVDNRVGVSHTFVYPEQPYYDSHCFNKDIPTIIGYADRINVETPLLDGMYEANRNKKKINNR